MTYQYDHDGSGAAFARGRAEDAERKAAALVVRLANMTDEVERVRREAYAQGVVAGRKEAVKMSAAEALHKGDWRDE